MAGLVLKSSARADQDFLPPGSGTYSYTPGGVLNSAFRVGRQCRTADEAVHRRRSLMSIGIVLVRKVNDTVNRLRSEMFGRSTSRHRQRHVRILDLRRSVRPSTDADLQRCWP